MVEVKLQKNSKEYEFQKILEIFIRKYETRVEASSNLTITFLSLFGTLIIAFIIAYIGWNIEGLKNSFLIFWTGNWLLKFILFCIMFTIIYFTFKLLSGVARFPKVERFILSIFAINNLQSEVSKLNLLYLASLHPQKWEIKIKVEEDKGILDLLEIKKIE